MLFDTRRDSLMRRARDLEARGRALIEQAREIDAMLSRCSHDNETQLLAGMGDIEAALGPVAEHCCSARRKRTRFFPETLFGEPGWDILLDLYVQTRRGQSVSISSASMAGGTAPTTGLRWLGMLEEMGLVSRERNAQDARMSWIRLTAEGRGQMEAYLASVRGECEAG